jgi:hypothetical protein
MGSGKKRALSIWIKSGVGASGRRDDDSRTESICNRAIGWSYGVVTDRVERLVSE